MKPDPDPNAEWIAHIMYHLKPFTQYAVYVQTFTVARATTGAMSPVVYFTTDPDGKFISHILLIRMVSLSAICHLLADGKFISYMSSS